jgi:hypothetical protein
MRDEGKFMKGFCRDTLKKEYRTPKRRSGLDNNKLDIKINGLGGG